MANSDGKTLEKLYLELGLDLSQLQADILAADKTVTENLGRLNRQNNLIKLRMEADIAGLDKATDAAKILEIQEKSLNQQLTLSKDKLAILEAAYKQVTDNQNSSALAVQNAEKAWQKARLEIGNLEARLKSLSTQKVSIDTTQLQDNISKLNAKIQHVKITAEIDTSKLRDAGSVFEVQKAHVAALTKELELQRQKLVELQNVMKQSSKINGAESVQTLNIKSNVLQQIQEINRLEARLKELSNTKIDLQFRLDSMRRVEAEINENISRINAKIEGVRVKTELDTSTLGKVASEFDRAKIQVQGLNRELDLQNQKLAELKRAFGTSLSTNGLNNVKTINLNTEIHRQIQAIDQLKAKINELNKIQPPKTNGLLSGYLNIKGDVTGKLNEITNAFSQLREATASADSAITASLGIIDAIPHPVGKAATALATLPIIFKGVENSIIEMTRAAAAAGDSVYVMSRGFQMSLKDTGQFTTNAKVAGADVMDLANSVKRVQQQIVKGGDDSRAAEWLKRYGESAYNASGGLKNLNEMTFALSRALKKAQADGKGVDFVLSVFRNISADSITAIEDIEAVNEQAKTIVKAGLGNPVLAHEVQGNLNALKVQSGQLNASFTNALLPVANEVIPRVTERIGNMVQIIKDNKDVIKEVGKDLASIWSGIETAADVIGSVIGKVGGVLKDIYMAKTKANDRLVERYKNDTSIKTAEDLLKRELTRGYTPQDRAAIEATPYLYDQELKKYEPIIKAIQDAREKIKEEKKSLASELATDIAGEILKPFVGDLTQDITPALQKYRDEAKAIRYKLSHTDYENSVYDINQKYEKLLRDNEKSALEQIELEKLKNAELDKLDQERAEKLKEIRDSVASADKTALENKLDAIEKERQAWVKAGMEKEEAAKLADQKRLKAMQEASEKAQQYIKDAADIEYSLTHTAFEKQLRDIERWKEAQQRKAETYEEVLAIAKNAAMKEAEAFENAVDRIKGKLQSLDDKIFAQEHSQYEQDLRRIQQERIRYYEDFQKEGFLNAETQAKIEHWYNNAVNDLNKKLTESRKSGGDYAKAPDSGMQRGNNGIMVIGGDQIIDDGLVRSQQQEIGLITDENKIRAQLSQNLTHNAQEIVEEAQARNRLNAAQQNLLQATNQAADSFQIIEGDKFVNNPAMPTQTQSPNNFQVIEGDRIVSGLQEFGLALQEAGIELEQFDPVKSLEEKLPSLGDAAQLATDAQKSLAEKMNDFPPEYFKNLADGTKAVSEMQLSLTESTMSLIEAQGKLHDALINLPSVDSASTNERQLSTDGLLKLNYSAEDLQDAQNRLAVTTRDVDNRLRDISDIPPQSQPVQKDSGIKFGFDYDTAKDIFLTGVGLAATTASTGVGLALSPEILAGALVAAGVGGFAKGSYDETTAIREQPQYDDRLKPLSEMDLSGVITPLGSIDANLQSVLQTLQDKETTADKDTNLSELLSPLSNVDTPLASILQAMQEGKSYESDKLQEMFGELPNIRADVQSILAEMQARVEIESAAQATEISGQDYMPTLANIDGNIQSILQELQTRMTAETTVSFETVITPLNNIAGLVQNIFSALENRQPPQITVAPNNNIDLGGAYVFDEAMKASLVEDITSKIVAAITSAVNQATSKSSYGFAG